MNKISQLAAALTASAITLSAAVAQDGMRPEMGAHYHLSSARGPVRQVDLSPFKGDVSTEILASPANGLESAFIMYSRMAPGARPTGLYTLPVDHTYLVLAGKLNVQLGTDQFLVEPETLVFVPAGVPHRVWNAGAEPEADVQVVTPAPSGDLVSMMKPAEARKIDNAAQYIRVAPHLEKLSGGTGHASLNERVLASRKTGSRYVLERLNEVLPGGGRTETHMHPFDQAYFVRSGTLTVRYGMKTYEAGANTLVLIPAGVVHNNENKGASVQSAITLLLPEPEKGNPMGMAVDLPKAANRGQE